MIDGSKIRAQFPALHQKVNGKDLVYFDNAASSQKPQIVLNAIARYYSHDNANIHRGVHYLSQEATNKFENTRKSRTKPTNCYCNSLLGRVGLPCYSDC